MTGEAKLFVGGLPLTAGEDEIRHTFAPFGELTEIYMLPNHSRTGQRCAFVKFTDWARANAAITALSGKHQMRPDMDPIVVRPKGTPPPNDATYGRGHGPIQPHFNGFGTHVPQAIIGGQGHGAHNVPPDGTKLFVGGLPGYCDESTIRPLFSQFGELTEVFFLPNNSKTGQRCAFVRYTSWHSAQAAVEALNGRHRFGPGEDPIVVRPKEQGTGRHPVGCPASGGGSMAGAGYGAMMGAGLMGAQGNMMDGRHEDSANCGIGFGMGVGMGSASNGLVMGRMGCGMGGGMGLMGGGMCGDGLGDGLDDPMNMGMLSMLPAEQQVVVLQQMLMQQRGSHMGSAWDQHGMPADQTRSNMVMPQRPHLNMQMQLSGAESMHGAPEHAIPFHIQERMDSYFPALHPTRHPSRYLQIISSGTFPHGC